MIVIRTAVCPGLKEQIFGTAVQRHRVMDRLCRRGSVIKGSARFYPVPSRIASPVVHNSTVLNSLHAVQIFRKTSMAPVIPPDHMRAGVGEIGGTLSCDAGTHLAFNARDAARSEC
jgi:hypothetical protein